MTDHKGSTTRRSVIIGAAGGLVAATAHAAPPAKSATGSRSGGRSSEPVPKPFYIQQS